jgi:hypothetical protein
MATTFTTASVLDIIISQALTQSVLKQIGFINDCQR